MYTVECLDAVGHLLGGGQTPDPVDALALGAELARAHPEGEVCYGWCDRGKDAPDAEWGWVCCELRADEVRADAERWRRETA